MKSLLVSATIATLVTAASWCAAEPPAGLSDSDWSGIRRANERERHAIVNNPDGTRQARNPGQAWLTRFDARGFTVTPDAGGWEWGLELIGYGGRTLTASAAAVAQVSHEGDRVSYVRDADLTEWFINDARGLEQGWTLAKRPAPADAAGALLLHLAIRGGLHPQVAADGGSVAFLHANGGTALTYGGLTAWDADGKAVPARFADWETAGSSLCVVVDDAAARYPLTIDPLAYQAYLKASNTGAGDQFGQSVAVSGNTVVVGAGYEDSAATGVNGNQWNNSAADSGAAYVFVRSGTTWSQQAYLKASNTEAGDRFGFRVAVSGDTAVVTARNEDSAATGVNGNQADNLATGAGAAYVFVRSGNTWTQQAYLKASNTGTNDIFGTSVGVSGDTVVVGANGEASSASGVNGNQADNTAANAGAAYVFIRSGTTWLQQAYLKASNTGSNDSFGSSVAISDNTVVIGASSEASGVTGVNGNQLDNSASSAGAAYVFFRSGTTWSQQAYLKASNTGAGDFFGRFVAVSGDTVVVGASNEDSNATGVNGSQTNNSATDSGAAYVFVRSGTTWSQQAYLKASNTGASDLFGSCVAVSGDTVVVGAYREDSRATGVNDWNQWGDWAYDSGAAYVFSRSGTTWSQQAYLKATNTGATDFFGTAVAVSGDTVVVGANQEASAAAGASGVQSDDSAPNAGAVYVYSSARPANDDFANRVNLGPGATASATGTLAGATGEYGAFEPGLRDWLVTNGLNRDATVWYQWTAPAGSQWVTLTVTGPQVLIELSAYTGTALYDLTTVAMRYQNSAGEPQMVTFEVTPGTTYQIRVAFSWWDYHYEPGLAFTLAVAAFGNPTTVEQYLTRGRYLLGQGNHTLLGQAAADFTAVLALSPAHEEAHLLRALTNLLLLEAEPAFSQAVGDLGATQTGSLLSGGTLPMPKDAGGNLIFAAGTRSGILIDWVKNQLLPRLATVRSDLAAVTSNDFRILLGSSGIDAGGVMVDKGDVLVFTAVTHGLEMLFNLLFTYDLDVSFNAMVALDKNGELDAQHVLASSAALLKFAASDRRPQFAAALRAMQRDYATASDFIRNRRADPTNLPTEDLNTDPTMETEIRDTLAAAVASLDGEVTHQGTRVNLSRLVVTSMSLRDWVPEFRGREVMFGTLPDPTLDGILPDASGNLIYQMGNLWGLSQYVEEFGDFLQFMTGSDDPSADSDGDGRNNFAEWLALSNPILPDTVWQEFTHDVMAPGQNEVRLSFVRRTDLRDWKLRVAVSDDMATWDRTETQLELVGAPIDNGDGFTETVTYRLKSAAALASRKFLRVEAAPQ
ncbi:MAG: FG-GAP repeat protein [Verrucomicrobia bacterium]|nr:FG-GAP repeat protein [Verrucomicrobiota bacterium]